MALKRAKRDKDQEAQFGKDEKASEPPSPSPPSPTLLHLNMRTISFLALCSVLLTWSLLSLSAYSIPASQSSSSAASADATSTVVEEYVAPSAFPTKAFDKYYVPPTNFDQVPRPAIKDYDTGKYFPESLDQPYPLPTLPPASDAVYPNPTGKRPPSSANYTAVIKANITALLGDASQSTCDRCLGALQLGQKLAHAEPKSVPGLLIDLCTQYNYSSTASGLSQAESCKREYAGATLGAMYTQILSYAKLQNRNDSVSHDGEYICYYILGAKSACPAPAPLDLNADGFLDKWFGGKDKRQQILKRAEDVQELEKRKGYAHLSKRSTDGRPSKHQNTIRLLHFSDIHVDPRFFVGGEGACTSGQCCRSDSFNKTMASGPPLPPGTKLAAANVSEAAHYWGNYHCDSPWPLAVSAMQSVTHLNGGQPVDMSVYTGDMVTHDSNWHLSQDLVRYVQQSIFDSMKYFLGDGPVFSAIGNHDTSPSDQASPRALPDKAAREAFSYDWNNLARLFEAEGWFTHQEAKQVARHYGGYSVSPRKGLRIITINTDFWYKGNRYNFIHTDNPDYSGTLRFLTDELERAERRGERVWIVGHVLTGWDGTNPLQNPTNLFYQIVDHYAPRTIAHIFLGHTHEDQFNVFYADNATARITSKAKAVSFMGPSITPGTNVNSAVRIYSVDPYTYEVTDYDQFYTQVNDFAGLPDTDHGPVWQHLYSARQTYGTFNASAVNGTVGDGAVTLDSGNTWPKGAPLNATFWSALTDEMEKRPELVSDVFHHYQGRNSPRTKPCNSTCVAANICYMRSGSASIGLQCPQGFGSVQGG